MKKSILTTLFLILIAGMAYSQDKIYRKNGKVLDVKIVEVGSDIVKYKQPDKGEDILFSLEKDRIAKIVYATGKTERYMDNLRDPELYADQAQQAIKINFLSPLFGFTQLSYEHMLRPGQSYELAVGIIGLGKNQEIMQWNDEHFRRDAGGVFFGGGMKFIKLPNFRNRGTRYTHIMQGSYLRPNLLVGFYKNNVVVNKADGYETEKKDVTFGALTIDLGRQWVFGDRFLFDMYLGVGYALDNISKEDSDTWVDFVHNHFAVLTSENSGFGIRAGLKIGLLFK